MKIYHGQIQTLDHELQMDNLIKCWIWMIFLWDRDMSFFGGVNHCNETNMTRHIESMIDVEAWSSTEFTTIYYTYYTLEM